MTADTFWNIITRTLPARADGNEAQVEALAAELSKLSPDDIAGFQAVYYQLIDQAYTWDLWGAAYVIGGGCSDDSFDYFRSGVISCGRSVYERAVADADSLADADLGPEPEETAFFEEFAYIASDVYEEKIGDEMPYPERTWPKEPAGVRWEEESAVLAARYPRLWARYGKA